MKTGDIVAVIDPGSSRRGMWGLVSHTTRAGRVVVNFMDGGVEAMDPFHVEDYAGLMSTAVVVRKTLPSRGSSSDRPVVRSCYSHSCRCGHPQHKHREYHGYVACTCLDAPRRQCRCRCFTPLPAVLQSVLRELFQRAPGGEREWDRDEAASALRPPGLAGAA